MCIISGAPLELWKRKVLGSFGSVSDAAGRRECLWVVTADAYSGWGISLTWRWVVLLPQAPDPVDSKPSPPPSPMWPL